MIYKTCPIEIDGDKLVADLVLLDIRGFDEILGMDWLTIHHASVDCIKKTVCFSLPKQVPFIFRGTSVTTLPNIISSIKHNV